MEKRRASLKISGRCTPSRLFPIFPFLFSLFCASTILVLAGCGTPGDPVPPRPPIPQTIADLAARQAGESVVLTFTLPRTTVEGLPLEGPPPIEIYRGFLPADAKPAPGRAPVSLAYTIPSALVDTYLTEGRIRFLDPLKPEDLAQHAGQQLVYLVRTRAPMHRGRPSADSNLAALRVYPAPERIREITATLAQTEIRLGWVPPERTTTGASLVSVAAYRIYRAELEPGTAAAAAADPEKAKLKTPLELLGVSPSAYYSDTQFEFGRTYFYTVRSVAQYESDSVESEDSRPLVVTPRDTFAPATPEHLVVVLVPGTEAAPAQLELSWSISQEADLAGYNVYRSEQGSPEGSGRGERINPELLPIPTFRDIWVAPGRRYTYTVTAVDRAGNESPPSAPVSEEVPNRERSR